MSARPGPDLAAAGYTETEYAVSGTAPSYTADELPTDGRWELAGSGEADFVTRAMVRRPADPAAFSGTLVAEWLNVSSGADAAPDWTYAGRGDRAARPCVGRHLGAVHRGGGRCGRRR